MSGSDFEIDTNANLKVDDADCMDWLAGSTGSALRAGVMSQADQPTGSGDDSFGKGASENDSNPAVVSGSIPPNKSDLKRFGLYTETAGTAKFLHLFWSRVQNPSGTTNMDFELNQKSCDPNATPTNCAGNGTTPVRTVSDKLITYDLSNGGTVPTISIRSWTGSAWGAATELTGTGTAIGSVNTTAINSADADGIGAHDAYTFGEASISFTALFGTGGGQCGTFGSAYLKSRSSDSFTAALKDFIAPQQVHVSNCASLVTNADQSVTIGSSISDTASLEDVTANAGGSITFTVYDNDECSGDALDTSVVPVSGPDDYTSDSYTPTAVGTYYWMASYSGDANNSGANHDCAIAGEISQVVKAQPTISTTATSSQTIEGAISDTATLSGATSDAGGTITFRLYSDASCQTEVTTGLSPVSVSGNGNYGSGNYTPTSVGTYRWIASYSGDAKNLAATGACNDANETSTVNKKQPTISTSATASVTIGTAISDTATLSNATSDAGGTITFRLYSDASCQTEVTTGLSPVSVSGNGNYGSGNYTPTSVGTYRWIARYSGDAKNLAATGACNDANETSTVNRAGSTIATAQWFYPQDSVTLTAGAGGTPTGSVTFKLYGPNDADCSGSVKFEQTVALVNGEAQTSNSTFKVEQANAGEYRWLVTYPGDDNHDGATKACGAERFSVTITE